MHHFKTNIYGTFQLNWPYLDCNIEFYQARVFIMRIGHSLNIECVVTGRVGREKQPIFKLDCLKDATKLLLSSLNPTC